VRATRCPRAQACRGRRPEAIGEALLPAHRNPRSGEAVRAHDHANAFGMAPVAIGDAVKTCALGLRKLRSCGWSMDGHGNRNGCEKRKEGNLTDVARSHRADAPRVIAEIIAPCAIRRDPFWRTIYSKTSKTGRTYSQPERTQEEEVDFARSLRPEYFHLDPGGTPIGFRCIVLEVFRRARSGVETLFEGPRCRYG